MSKRVNPEYQRKINVAREIADAAWIAGGWDAMKDEERSLRMLDADPVIISELSRLCRRMA